MNELSAPAGKADDSYFLGLALAQARAAQAAGEVPVGAVVVYEGQVIAAGHNEVIAKHDPSAHAEVLALRRAGQYLGNYRLQNCDLYVTLEPCAMCAAALAHARIRRVIYALPDPKAGAAGSALDVLQASGISHRVAAQCSQNLAGMDAALQAEIAALLPEFFQAKRRAQARAAWPLHPHALRTPQACFRTVDPPLPGALQYCADLPSLAGLRLHYWDSAQAEPELAAHAAQAVDICLHDGLSWSQDFADYYAAHGAQRRVLVLDLPGFGRSDKWKKRSAYSQDWWAQIVQEFVQHLAPEALAAGQLRLVLPQREHLLAPSLQRAWPQLQWPALICPLVPQRQAWQDLPYPDAGHRAGPAAWLHISASNQRNRP